MYTLFLNLSCAIFFYRIIILNFNQIPPISRKPSQLYNPYHPVGNFVGGFGAVSAQFGSGHVDGIGEGLYSDGYYV